jgi:hypothetical protein
MVSRQLGWMVWVLAGSYYIRSGTQDYDETYGNCSVGLGDETYILTN